MPKYTFHITEKIISQSTSWDWLWVPLWILISPLLLFYAVLLIVWYGLKNAWASILYIEDHTILEQKPPIYLLQSEHLQIELLKVDSSFDLLVDDWYNITYDDEETIYEAATQPMIKGIHGELITNFVLEKDKGVFLQKIIADKYVDNPLEIESTLVWIDYEDMNVKASGRIGPSFLHTNDEEKNQIKGFNAEKEICVSIVET